MTEGAQDSSAGMIFDIKKFAVHDGPGIRTTVFFKGCPLNCIWCHNPESISPKPQLVFFQQKCIGCRKCMEVCPTGALAERDGARRYDGEKCRMCGRCVEVCYAEAWVMQGRSATVTEIIEEIEKDRPFYENSGGGATFSGGEPMMQPEFLRSLLIECKNRGLHTAVDTCGHAPWREFEGMLDLVDLFLYDIKHMDPAKHKKYTGVDNGLILDNARRIDRAGKAMWVRVPVVPGCNDDVQNMRATADFCRELVNLKRVEFLPYHRLAESKYRRLGRHYRLAGTEPPADDRLAELKKPFIESGVTVDEA